MEKNPYAGWIRRIIPYGTWLGMLGAYDVPIEKHRREEKTYTAWQILIAIGFVTPLVFGFLWYANDLNQVRAVPGTNPNVRSIDCIHDIAYSAGTNGSVPTLGNFNARVRTVTGNQQVCTWHNNTDTTDWFAVVPVDDSAPSYQAPQLWLQYYMPSLPQYDFVILSSLILKTLAAVFVALGAVFAFVEAFAEEGTKLPMWMRQFFVYRSFWLDVGLYSVFIGGCQMAYFYFAFDIKRVEFKVEDDASQDRLYNAFALALATWVTSFFCWMQLRNRTGFSLATFLMTAWVYVDTFYYFFVWTWWYAATTTYEEVFNPATDKLFQFDYGTFATLHSVWPAFWTIMTILSLLRFIAEVRIWNEDTVARIKNARLNVLYYSIPVVWYYAFAVGHHDHDGKSDPVNVFNYFYERVDFSSPTTVLDPARYCNSNQFSFNFTVGWETALLIAHASVTAVALIFYGWKVIADWMKTSGDEQWGYFWNLILLPETQDEVDQILVYKDGEYQEVELDDDMFYPGSWMGGKGSTSELLMGALSGAQNPINLTSGEEDNKRFWDKA